MTDDREALRTKKKSEVIASILRREIVEGLQQASIKEGEPLASEQALLERFGVSRPTLREAMRLLEIDRLVDLRVGANGGIRVRFPPPTSASRQVALQLYLSDAKLAEVFELIATIQAEAARLAAIRAQPDDLESLSSVISETDNVIENSVAANKVYDRIQETIVAAAHDAAMTAIHQVLRGVIASRFELMGRAWIDRDDTVELNRRSIRSMRRLVKLLAAGDPDAAARHWRQHHDNANALFFEVIDPDQQIDLSNYW